MKKPNKYILKHLDEIEDLMLSEVDRYSRLLGVMNDLSLLARDTKFRELNIDEVSTGKSWWDNYFEANGYELVLASGYKSKLSEKDLGVIC